MGCGISTPKVKESKSPPAKTVPESTSAVHQRRPAPNAAAPPPPVAPAPTGTAAPPAPPPPPPDDATPQPPKADPNLGKVPSSKVRPTVQIPSQPEEPEKRKEKTPSEVVPRPVSKSIEGEQIAAGWPAWLASVASEAIKGWVPRRADSFEKLDKIGQGTYSNVYKARDLETGKLVALKKVRFDNLEPESVRFMAREIEVLRRLDHPNIVKLEGLVTSRMSCSLYLVFEYMEHDLAGLAASPGVTFTEAQVKCYMQQLIRGLEHCHTNGVLHRDIKGSNLLLDNSGTLKIADFGLATFYRPEQNVPLTSRVVTLWYRPPELLLGATNYGVAVDLWSAGCILAELLAGKPIMPGRTEVEQLHKIFKLCGSPSEEYWRKSKLPHATIFKPSQPYKRNLKDVFKDFPATSLALLDILLAIEPGDRGHASQALKHDFFTTEPLPCDPSSLPQYPPSKEYDAKLRDEEARRNKAAGSRAGRGALNDKEKRNSTSLLQQPPKDRSSKAVPAPHANAELPESIAMQKQNIGKQTSGPVAKSSSERFLGESAQGQAAGGGMTGMTSAQFKTLDTPDGPMPGGKDRHLHRTGTTTRLGSTTGAGGGPATGGWQGSQGVPGGASTGKFAGGGQEIGDRSLSMAQSGLGKGGPSLAVSTKDIAGGLQAGDVSFTIQKKVGAVSGELSSMAPSVQRNRTQSVDEKDLDLSFQGGPGTAGKGASRPSSSTVAAGGGPSSSSAAPRKSGPLGDKHKVDPKTWMLTQAGGEQLPAGVAAALAAARDGPGNGAAPPAEPAATAAPKNMSSGLVVGPNPSRNSTAEPSPRGKGTGSGGAEAIRPRSGGGGRPREASPSKDKRPPSERTASLAEGSPKGAGGVRSSWDVSPRGQASPGKSASRSQLRSSGPITGP